MITRANFNDWLDNPVTQELIHKLEDSRDRACEDIFELNIDSPQLANRYSNAQGQYTHLIDNLDSIKTGYFVEFKED